MLKFPDWSDHIDRDSDSDFHSGDPHLRSDRIPHGFGRPRQNHQ